LEKSTEEGESPVRTKQKARNRERLRSGEPSSCQENRMIEREEYCEGKLKRTSEEE